MQQSVIVDGSIRTQCPVDMHPLLPVPVSNENDIQRIVSQARSAQRSWEDLGFEKRVKLMKQAGKKMLERRQEVLEILNDEAGKTPAEMLMSEVVGPLQYISDWARVARSGLKSRRLPISPLAFPRKHAVIDMLPRGVVGIIASWNYPLANFFKPVFPALLCGNSVIIKPSEYTPRTAEWFVKVMGEFLPAGVLSVVQGDGETGRALIRSGIDALTFTGSFETGKKVAQLAAEQMIPCSVELGGKDAAIILNDCDLDRTVAGIMHWSLHNAGQACGDIERVYVEEGIADQFIERLTAAVSSLRVHSGDVQSSDVGPSIHIAQLQIVEGHIQEAVSKGAQLLCGGKRTGKGLWLEPTILDHCDHSMKVMREPTFGPVIPLCRVKNAEEAVRLVNDCEYGLNGSVWSGDIRRATEIAKRLEVGTVFVNNHAFTGAVPAAPWTGVKKTGHGIANSMFALQHYTRPRTVVVDRKKSVDGWWFPMDEVAEELGHSLAGAQLGNVMAALKIPFLMSRRQRTVMSFVREGRKDPANPPGPHMMRRLFQSVSSFRHRFKLALLRMGKRMLPSMTSREIVWVQIAMETVLIGSPPSLQLVSREKAKVFIEDLYDQMPFPANLLFRFSVLLVGLAPIFLLGKLTSLEKLSKEDQLRVLDGFVKSNVYLLREIALLMKMNAALLHTSTSRFHEALAPASSRVLPEMPLLRPEAPSQIRSELPLRVRPEAPSRPQPELEV